MHHVFHDGWRSVWLSLGTLLLLVHRQDWNLRTAPKASYPSLRKILGECFIHASLDAWERANGTQGAFRETQGLGLSTGRRHDQFSTTDSWWLLNRLQTRLQQMHVFFSPAFPDELTQVSGPRDGGEAVCVLSFPKTARESWRQTSMKPGGGLTSLIAQCQGDLFPACL